MSKPKEKKNKPLLFPLQYDACLYFEELLTTEYGILHKRIYEGGQYKKTIEYLDLICSFDIETSSFILGDKKCATMYSWQFGINGKCYVGRTWSDFEKCIYKLMEFYKITDDRRVVIYVHNLSYEFQWILKRFTWKSVFAREKGEPLKANTDSGIEFRDSLVLSGCSLASTAKNLTLYKINKMVGDLDYTKLRGSITPLTRKEMQYCINDVLVVMAYIREQVELYGDLLKIPMTNTGRVRKACRKKCLGRDWGRVYRKLVSTLQINDINEYNALLRAFAGGFTHANYFRVGELIENVYSRDFTSSYPTVMVCEKFPMGKAEIKNGMTLEEMEFIRPSHKIVFNVRFFNLRMKEDVYDCPLSVSKCNIQGRRTENNGRLMSGDIVTTTTTDVDFFEIIKLFYEWDSIEIGTAWVYPSSYLPTPLVELIIELYEDKTTLKDLPEYALEYLIKKGMLNSAYGMAVMRVISAIISLVDGEWTSTDEDPEITLQKYNEDKKRFLFYPWGVFVTAYSRRNLFSGIRELGSDYIYADTDSVKFTNYEKHKAYFERYNAWIAKKIEHALNLHKIPIEKASPKTVEGKIKPLGVWDDDGFYLQFKTLGAKRYMYKSINKKRGPKSVQIHTTVAGVSKDGLALYLTYLDRHYGGNKAFDFFDDNMTIPAQFAHKTTALYFDEPIHGEATDYKGNKFKFEEKSYVYISESSYNMKLSEVFKTLLGMRQVNILR